MCIIIAKEKNKEFNKEKLDYAYESNKDGCGVMWFDSELGLQTYKTLDYEEFKTFLDTNDWFKDKEAVLHLRYTTVGETNIANCHPFTTGNGAVMHNGTIRGLKPKDKDKSDSRMLSELIDSWEHTDGNDFIYGASFRFLFEEMLGSINRVVYMENDGTISIFNEEAGAWIDDIWYSNDYYRKKRYTPTKHKQKYYSSYGQDEYYYEADYTPTYTSPKEAINACNRVFVYGTLKMGFGNHATLSGASYDPAKHKCLTLDKFAMIGKDNAFPYVVEEDDDFGKYIKGELYNVDKHIMARLDTLEGYPHHYHRKVIQVVPETGGVPISAWIYYNEEIDYKPCDCIDVFEKKEKLAWEH